MVRALSDSYDGMLYQVRRADGITRDIGLLAPGGFANAADQDAFCGAYACTVSIVYDQSGNGNDLTSAPIDCYLNTLPPSPESDARGRSLTVSGHAVYGLYTVATGGYRCDDTRGMPVDADEQGVYEVVDGKRVGDACCYDFGNGSTNDCPYDIGQPNALFFGTGYWGSGDGDGPWFMADFGEGVWSGGSGASQTTNLENPSMAVDYAFGILKTDATSYTLRAASVGSGKLVTAYDGSLPFAAWAMQGAVILGTASDVSDASFGTFFEGAITRGRPSDATDEAVLANVRAMRYGQ